MKDKYDKRRALFCKLLGKSKSYEGYYKYLVTIGEKDGTIHKQPVYGRDMQNALNRLMNKELTIKVEKKLETGWVFFAWLFAMSWPALIYGVNGIEGNMWWITLSLGSILVMTIIAVWWYNYVNVGD
jgi:hypothetical protein|tara:strand:+ start:3328 stop:3708 length:381 start_codon:yes stop_codon:yes gene_type:complete